MAGHSAIDEYGVTLSLIMLAMIICGRNAEAHFIS